MATPPDLESITDIPQTVLRESYTGDSIITLVRFDTPVPAYMVEVYCPQAERQDDGLSLHPGVWSYHHDTLADAELDYATAVLERR